MRWANFGTLSMRSTMYEVLDVSRMIRIKSPHVRNRTAPPVKRGVPKHENRNLWGGLLLINAGTPSEALRLLPDGSEIKCCIQDKSVWEVYIPLDFKKNVKLLAKRLDAIAFM